MFEPTEARRGMETALAENGTKIRIHSAYKTLLNSILDLQLFDNVIAATIQYPVVEHDEPLRFRLECYPLQDLFPNIEITFLPVNHTGDGLPAYRLNTHTATEENELAIEVPVRWRRHPSGKRLLVATGWQKTEQGLSDCLITEYEQIYDDVCNYLQALPLHPLNSTELEGPFFEQLNICVTAPFQDQPLPVGNEALSLAEAMHEEIYFTAIEIFQKRLNLPALSRELKPGQILPMICNGPNVSLSISEGDTCLSNDIDNVNPVSLSEATHWLYASQVKACLRQISGQAIQATSRQGRRVEGRIVRFAAVPESACLAISGAQHANESSGVIGALRAALELQQTGKVSFSVCPLENVDGYALYHKLCSKHPHHMHHAARYTAGGNDLTHGGGTYESAIRNKASQALPARVHVNLHGYPAHEWTRPLSGYVPDGFSRWTIPKGFFLICDYADESELALANVVLHAALRALYDYPEMMAVNRRMLSSYENIVGSLDFQVYRDSIPFTLTHRVRKPYPISLITEAPDESIYGDDFKVAHEAQYRVVVAVAEAIAGYPSANADTVQV